MPLSLVLADTQPIVLDGLSNLLHRYKTFRILARCNTCEDTLRALRKHRPDILVLELQPIKCGFEVLRHISQHKLRTRSVVFASNLNDEEIIEAIRLGASGVIRKDMPPKFLIECVKTVQKGEKWFDPRSSATATQKLLNRESATRQTYEALSARQIQIARMVANGLRNKEIGKKLFICEGTVQIHLHHIYAKLHLSSRLALALFARDAGLV